MNDEPTITVTVAQAQVIQQALDAAIRAGGANAAVRVLPVMQAIEEQIQAVKEGGARR